mgnify:CR=1 FL=1
MKKEQSSILTPNNDLIGVKKSEKKEEKEPNLPKPTGWRMIVLPFKMKEKTKGGLILGQDTLEKQQVASQCGLVLAMGPHCYDKEKFPEGSEIYNLLSPAVKAKEVLTNNEGLQWLCSPPDETPFKLVVSDGKITLISSDSSDTGFFNVPQGGPTQLTPHPGTLMGWGGASHETKAPDQLSSQGDTRIDSIKNSISNVTQGAKNMFMKHTQ